MRIALETHLVKKGDMSVLKLGVSFWEICGENISYAKPVTSYLVCVSRSNTLEGRSDLTLAHCRLVGCIKKSVGRKDQVGFLCDDDTLSYRNACLCSDVGAFAHESDRVEHDAVTYDVLCVFSEDA